MHKLNFLGALADCITRDVLEMSSCYIAESAREM